MCRNTENREHRALGAERHTIGICRPPLNIEYVSLMISKAKAARHRAIDKNKSVLLLVVDLYLLLESCYCFSDVHIFSWVHQTQVKASQVKSSQAKSIKLISFAGPLSSDTPVPYLDFDGCFWTVSTKCSMGSQFRWLECWRFDRCSVDAAVLFCGCSITFPLTF